MKSQNVTRIQLITLSLFQNFSAVVRKDYKSGIAKDCVYSKAKKKRIKLQV